MAIWRMPMRVRCLTMLGAATVVIGCASAAVTSGTSATNVRTPLGAHLTPSAKTGAPVALRFDPTAHVVISTAANLPPAPFGADQAMRGEKVFDHTCATCH